MERQSDFTSLVTKPALPETTSKHAKTLVMSTYQHFLQFWETAGNVGIRTF